VVVNQVAHPHGFPHSHPSVQSANHGRVNGWFRALGNERLDSHHPNGKQHDVQIDESHRSGEPRDLIGNS
jgi:hypothetical protein